MSSLWIESDVDTGGIGKAADMSRVFVSGDFNAYAFERPVTSFLENSYVSALDLSDRNSYSYVFQGAVGTLDHALISSTYASNVLLAEPWHINADEPTIFDYNLDFNAAEMYAPDVFRASDHDPLCVVLDLQPPSATPDAVVASDGDTTGTTTTERRSSQRNVRSTRRLAPQGEVAFVGRRDSSSQEPRGVPRTTITPRAP